jgi:hypothetical protein
MVKKSLYWGLMATSLYFVWGCSESGQAVGAKQHKNKLKKR